MARPLWIVGITLLLALLAAPWLGLNVVLVLAVVGFAAFVGALALPVLRRYTGLAAVCLTVSLSFVLYACFELLQYRSLVLFDGETVPMEARLIEPVTLSGQTAGYLATVTGGKLPSGTKVTLWYSEADCYDLVSGEFVLSAADGDGLSLLTHKAQGSFLTGYPAVYGGGEIAVRTPDTRPWYTAFAMTNRSLQETIGAHLSGDVGALVTGMCLGSKDALSDEAAETFRLTGVSHLLAVSGLHLTILAQALLALLRFLHCKRAVASGIAMGGVVLFMALVGFRPSVVRAGVMMLMLLLGQCLRRPGDSLNSLGFSLLLLLLLNPFAAYDVGLLLSFAATLGLTVLYPRMNAALSRRLSPREEARRPKRTLLRGLRTIGGSFVASFAAILPTLPLLALFFGTFSLVAPVTNLLTVFPSSLLMIVGFMGVALSPVPFLRWLAYPFFLVAGLLSRWLLWVTQALSRLPFASISVNKPYVLVGCCGLLLLLWLGWRARREKGLLRAVALSAVILLSGGLCDRVAFWNVTSITVADTKGDAAVLLEYKGHTALVLTADEPATLTTVSSLLRRRGVTKLDLLILPREDELLGIAGALPQIGSDTTTLYIRRTPSPDDLDPAAEPGTDSPNRSGSVYPLNNGAATFWDGATAVCEQGFLRLTLGQTRILICPPDGDASALSPSLRQTHLVIFCENPTRHAGAITAQAGVLQRQKDFQAAADALSIGQYPVIITGRDGEHTFVTRGHGDIR